MVRDQSSGLDRHKLDEVLGGKMPLPVGPDLDTFDPHARTAERELSDAEIEAMRENWGRDTNRSFEQITDSFGSIGAPIKRPDVR